RLREADPDGDSRGRTLRELAEALLVALVPAPERGELYVGLRQQARERGGEEVDALLLGEPRYHSEERGIRRRQTELGLQRRLAACLAARVVAVVVSGKVPVGRRVPFGVVDPVQYPAQPIASRAQDAVEALAELRRLDLACVAGAHGRDRV